VSLQVFLQIAGHEYIDQLLIERDHLFVHDVLEFVVTERPVGDDGFDLKDFDVGDELLQQLVLLLVQK